MSPKLTLWGLVLLFCGASIASNVDQPLNDLTHDSNINENLSVNNEYPFSAYSPQSSKQLSPYLSADDTDSVYGSEDDELDIGLFDFPDEGVRGDPWPAENRFIQKDIKSWVNYGPNGNLKRSSLSNGPPISEATRKRLKSYLGLKAQQSQPKQHPNESDIERDGPPMTDVTGTNLNGYLSPDVQPRRGRRFDERDNLSNKPAMADDTRRRLKEYLSSETRQNRREN
ncbi:hypothetical protein H4R33_001531 [Dimargaris cristalligena]|uniref:Secreted protein n=1 Tax=Dimargaris cristalligena TaxID=215637 RepID=A0A4Q0A205_9FUNG|nr:hypothetical protein H4R33_001531 [Dimargaris cristalligena]RKP39200.1 hypothetical protein BJ085DRAFT_30689 [Dimargaris cristalligena]|eukprot:RKP39200.1 hypothetical protein BJ085DRAFT_30689 [Dimargaris cristalligena]